MQKHAAACSECRVQLEEWRAALWDYAAFHHQELKPSLPPPPRPWKPLGRGRLGWMPRIRDPRIWAALAAGVLLGVFLYQTAEETVSAAEILDKAQARKTAASAPAERRIRIRTGSASFVRPAVMTSEREDLSSLRSLFEQANYSWDDPLSARSFARWRSQLPSKEDEVRVFRNNELVEITEALTDDEPAPAIPPAHMAAAPPSPATPGPADELRVLAALNRLGADLGEPVEVHRDARRVIVSGLGLDLSRQDQIRDAVGRLPHVALRFEDPRPAAETAMIAADSLAMPVPEAVHEELEQQLGGPAAVEEYINRLLGSSRIRPDPRACVAASGRTLPAARRTGSRPGRSRRA
ncbi:MAG: hypothetical protein IPM24_19925 [Bryobacterales bacterium]|nr:hypothetical protein [Bryobacterales bacterium]